MPSHELIAIYNRVHIIAFRSAKLGSTEGGQGATKGRDLTLYTPTN